MIKEYVDGRSCAVLGLGVSNLPLARELCEAGVTVNIYDRSTAEQIGESAVMLRERGANFFVADRDFCGIEGELIFRSPGIRPDREGIVAALGRGAELTSEAELFLKLTPATAFAVTGSDGKTTTTTLAGRFFERYLARENRGRAFVGGNIGVPLLPLCGDMTKDDVAVMELSSFQLMTSEVSAHNAAITNISPNHLDWHTDMDEYVAAKKNAVGARTRRLVTNADNRLTVGLAREICEERDIELIMFSSTKSGFEQTVGKIKDKGIALYVCDGYVVADDGHDRTRLLAISDIRIPGRHNVENFMAAIGLTYGYVPKEIYGEVARDFFGVEHRLEFVRTLDGVSYYNSSIDSSPTRTAAALSALCDRSIVLMCGGYDKKIPYEPLAEAIYRHGGVRAVVLTGDTGEKIGRAMSAYAAENACDGVYTEYCRDFEGAVRLAHSVAREGDVVLLSPASASFDAFKNFAERGNAFGRIVNELT